MTLEEQAKTMLAEIAKARHFITAPTSTDEYYKTAQKLISQQAYFVGFLVDAEQKYEERKAALRKDGLSSSAAENQAKTEQEYTAYKKAKYVYELVQEQIMLLKKMLSVRENEYQQS